MINYGAGKILLSLVLALAGGFAVKQAAAAASEEYVRAAPSTAGALQVKGTQLTGSDGTPVQLKGISTHGIAWFPDYINEECFRQLHEEWNVNVIRLAMYTMEYAGYCAGGDQAYLKELISKGVEYATANDMYVIVDWHILADGDPNTNKEEAKAFFAEMSQKFAGYDNVLYEICNEPNGGTSWAQIKSYAEEIIGVIRANDSDAVILVGMPNWSQYVDEAAADPITDYGNIMYTLHFYAATHKEDLRSRMTQAIDAGLPVFVSEYGICDASGSGAIDEDQANAWVETMNAHGVSYIAWNLSNKDETSAVLKSSCTSVSGFTQEDLSDSGKWLYQMLTGAADGASTGSGSGEASADTGTGTGTQSDTASGAAGASSENGSDTGSASDAEDESAALSISESAAAGDGASVQSVDGVELSASLSNSWEADGWIYSQYNIELCNNSGSDYSSWAITVTFQEAFELSDGWNGDYAQEGNTLSIKAKDYNSSLADGGSVGDIGFIVKGGGTMTAVVNCG